MYALSGGAVASDVRQRRLPSPPARAYTNWSWLTKYTAPSAPTAGELDTAPPVADAHAIAAADGPGSALLPERNVSAPRHGQGCGAGPLGVDALRVAVALLVAVALPVALPDEVALVESLPIARPMPAAATKTKANARDLPLQTAGRRAKRRMAAGDENL